MTFLPLPSFFNPGAFTKSQLQVDHLVVLTNLHMTMGMLMAQKACIERNLFLSPQNLDVTNDKLLVIIHFSSKDCMTFHCHYNLTMVYFTFFAMYQ